MRISMKIVEWLFWLIFITCIGFFVLFIITSPFLFFVGMTEALKGFILGGSVVAGLTHSTLFVLKP